MRYILLSIILIISLFAEEYELGNGYKINDKLHIGGYISTEYSGGKNLNTFTVDDAALLLYGRLMPKMTYFAELELNLLYVHDFNTQTSKNTLNAHAELFYLDYVFSDKYKVRIGKQTTPIGYWNYEPINVLRDTASNPLYSFQAFPKSFTGIDMYGYITESSNLMYHLFTQVTQDLKNESAYVKSDYFYGASMAYDMNENFSAGATIARYKNKNNKHVVNMYQANVKHMYNNFEIQAEVAYNDISNLGKYDLYTYVQGKYSISTYNALITRYEYMDGTINTKKIALIGYSYRPTPGISLKSEYQKYLISDDEKILMSLSILF